MSRFLLMLLACSCGRFPLPGDRSSPRDEWTDAPPSSPTVALVVPASGPDYEEGQRALRGARLALGESFTLTQMDPAHPESIAELARSPGLTGIIIWAPGFDLSPYRRIWEENELFVVVASPGPAEGLPHVVPDPVSHARCVASLVPGGRLVLVGDGSFKSELTRPVFLESLGRRIVKDLSADMRGAPSIVAEIEKTKATNVLFIGDARTAAVMVRSLGSASRKIGFLGVDIYDPAFLTEAGRDAEGAVVTTSHRPVWNENFLDRFQQRYSELPSPAAVDTYDAALLLKQLREATLVTAGGSGGIRLNLPKVSVNGAAGTFAINDLLGPEPSFCTAMEVRGGYFLWKESAKLVVNRSYVVRDSDDAPPPPPKSTDGFLYPPATPGG